MTRDLLIGFACFVAFVIVFGLLMAGPIVQAKYVSDISTRLPLLAITGVMALLASLALVSVVFSLADLSDKTQALGLPEGSVRAVIALSLIVLFAITAVYFHSSFAGRGLQRTEALTDQQASEFRSKLRSDEFVFTEPSGNTSAPSIVVYRLGSQASDDFAKQVFTLIGTLMTAVASFYFASRSGAQSELQPKTSSPSISSLSVANGSPGNTIPLQIDGSGLQLAQSVKLVQGPWEVLATDVTSSDHVVNCKVALAQDLPNGPYDVVVTNSDGGSAKLLGAFTVS